MSADRRNARSASCVTTAVAGKSKAVAAGMGWETRQTFYNLATAIRAMVEWAEEERLASAQRYGEEEASRYAAR
jgi:hypothetical protein